MSAEPILAIGDLAVDFPLLSGTVEAVRGCSLSIGKGEVMALVGESGCGKSMPALACLGLALQVAMLGLLVAVPAARDDRDKFTFRFSSLTAGALIIAVCVFVFLGGINCI